MQTSSVIICSVIALAASALVSPSNNAKDWQRWGQYLAALLVFPITFFNVARYNPSTPDALTNAAALWAIQAIGVGLLGFILGASAWWLLNGIRVVSRGAAEITRGSLAQAEQYASERETKKCPFCAETIKSKAVICRFCGRDLASLDDLRTSEASGHSDTSTLSGSMKDDAAAAGRFETDEDKFDAVLSEIQARYPQFVYGHPQRDPDLEDESVLRMRGYMNQGMDRCDALRLAIRDMERMGAFRGKTPPSGDVGV